MVNVTPDSFSDGGQFLSPDSALERARQLIEEGADILEIGGESTRPGASPVTEDEEVRRVGPVLEALRGEFPATPFCVDTVKSAVAGHALRAGASIINDVSGLRIDPAIASVCAEHGAGLVLMHSRGSVAEMASYRHAEYGQDLVGEVTTELQDSIHRAESLGVRSNQIAIDPGIGFSKRGEHSARALMELDRVCALGYPVMVGTSRKRFIGELSGVSDPASRVAGTIAANVMALTRGARLFRVHDVKANREALAVAWGLLASVGAHA